ncbi:unnamed protein product [Gulo gulo]|uniref:STAS domain-containing protein n=1 Tax=Gulo gulo TaxID=48420 RepID=A0A9X9M2W0_GULGU|nr:unnamed protein product [Gulo gulo]
MRQMFFQMQELPQLWRISRMDFVRSGNITPDCPLPFPSIPSLCPGLKLIVLVLNSVVPAPRHPQHAYLLIPLPRHRVEGGVSPAESILSLPPAILSTFSWVIPSYHLPWQAPRPWTFFPSSDGLAFHSHPCPAGCMDGHMGGRSDPECGPRPGRRCRLLHDDCGLPYPEVVQCLALGLAEGTELYRPLRESQKLLKVPGLCILSYPAPLYFGTRGQFRRTLEWHLGLGEGGKEAPKTDGPPNAVAEPVRVVVLDCSGLTFADAAGAREVVQLAGRCRDAGIHLLLAQCNAPVLGTLTQAGLLNRVTPEQLFVSVQDAAAHALERLVRGRSNQEVLGYLADHMRLRVRRLAQCGSDPVIRSVEGPNNMCVRSPLTSSN